MLKQLTLITALGVGLWSAPLAADDKADFHKILKDHWVQANKEQVFFRTDPDAFRPNGKLPEVTAEARTRRQAFNADILQRLEGIDGDAL